MTYTQQIIATLIGTLGGFIVALLMFYIKESFQSKKKEETLLKNLSYELDYNINLLGKYVEDLTKCIEKVSSDKKSVFTSIQYDKVAIFFAKQFYKEGLVSKYLHVEDLERWNNSLAPMGDGAEAYIEDVLKKWHDSTLEKGEVFDALNHERNQIKYAKEMFEYLKGKIKT